MKMNACSVMVVGVSDVLCRWQRETRIRNVGGRLQGDVAYYAPCGKKMRQYPDVVKVGDTFASK